MDVKDHPEAIIELSARDLDEMLEGASTRGARKALMEIGLDDERAVDDVRELRGLLSSWKLARSTFIKTVVQAITMALLGALALGAALKFGVMGGSLPPKP